MGMDRYCWSTDEEEFMGEYESREEARMNLSSNYDSRENFKIVKYEFK